MIARAMLLILVFAVSARGAEFSFETNDNHTVSVSCYAGEGKVAEIPESYHGLPVTGIYGCTFATFDDLEKVIIPASVTNIDAFCLFYCSPKLSSIQVDSANPSYCSEDGLLFNKDKTVLVSVPEGVRGQITLPKGMVEIWGGAFEDCHGLNCLWVEKGNPIFSSNDGVLFRGTTNLVCFPPGHANRDYVVPDGVREIEESAFGSCTNLNSVTFPVGFELLSHRLFVGSEQLDALYFKGNAPKVRGSLRHRRGVTVYYDPETSGWGPEFAGLPTAPWPQDKK
ncbi:leucine-rich repeat protein [Pontiella sp.]|uniref:leucine-rich repeat protein n=1 Tax=Pontiella sp. TaxID=2837462 RepID=UPI00356A776C